MLDALSTPDDYAPAYDVLAVFDVTRDGIEYRVTLTHDTDVRPTDYDCYTPADVAAWGRDEWCYVVVKVAAIIPGFDVSESDDYLGGVEYAPAGYAGFTATIDDDYIRDAHPVPDMIEEVRAGLVKIRDAAPRPSLPEYLATLDLTPAA